MCVSVVAERRTWFGLGKPRIEERALTRANVPAIMLGEPTVAGETVNDRTALQIVDVLACVRCIVESASVLPLIGYRRTETGRERLAGGRLPNLLRRPAPAVTQSNLVGHIVTSLVLRSEAFVGKYRNGEGEIEQLGVLPTDRVQIEIKGGMPLYTLTHDNGRQTTHGPSDVIHIRLPLTLDGIRGVAAIAMAREALGLARSLGVEASALVANSSAPLGVLSVPPTGPGTEDLLENLRAGIEARHRGARNRGRVAVLAGEVKFEPISITPHDMELVAQRKLSTVEIARLFRVPPWMIAADSGESLTYSNVETQAQAFVTFSLAPYLVAIEQAISADELCSENVYVEFLVDGLLRADSSTRATVYTAALDPITGWLTRAEVRRLENLAPEAA